MLPENDAPTYLICGNIARDDQIPLIVDEVLGQFGRIDLVINAAGVSHWGPILNGGGMVGSFDRQFRVNVRAPLALATEIANQFWAMSPDDNATQNRSIVNISSTAGLHVYPGQGQSVYGSTKAALNMLTGHMSDEFRPLGVRVNAIAPNSFPGRVPLEAVLQGIDALADGDMTGRLLVLDETGWDWR
jgi:NAD(P)-dependent dehydrogenase (short-subunit alcohol dehydrogenase family)